jgi:hypothetical protein
MAFADELRKLCFHEETDTGPGPFYFIARPGANQRATNGPAVVPGATVVVHKDPRIDLLIKKKAAINKAAKNGGAHGPGLPHAGYKHQQTR